jgi:hypothetical protein
MMKKKLGFGFRKALWRQGVSLALSQEVRREYEILTNGNALFYT